MTIQRFETGTRMSQAVVCGGFAFLAGQVAVDAPGAASPSRRATSWSASMRCSPRSDRTVERSSAPRSGSPICRPFEDMNAVWDAWVPAGHAPARATVEARLAEPQIRRRDRRDGSGRQFGLIASAPMQQSGAVPAVRLRRPALFRLSCCEACAMTDQSKAEIAIIGAGVIGLTIALRLAAEGRDVLVIEPNEPGSGASYGNAGTIADYAVLARGHAGRAAQPAMRSFSTGDSPLAIRLAGLPALLPWLLRFAVQSLPSRARANAAASPRCSPTPCRPGRIWPPSQACRISCGRVAAFTCMMTRRRSSRSGWDTGVAPAARRPAGGAVGRRGRASSSRSCRDPFGGRALFPRRAPSQRSGRRDAATGGRRDAARARALSPLRSVASSGGAAEYVSTGDALSITARTVVIAAGAHSRSPRRAGGRPVPLDTERGYHVEYDMTEPLRRAPGLPGRPRLLPGADAGAAAGRRDGGARRPGAPAQSKAHRAAGPRRAERSSRARRAQPGHGSAFARRCRIRFPSSARRTAGPRMIVIAFGHGHLGADAGADHGPPGRRRDRRPRRRRWLEALRRAEICLRQETIMTYRTVIDGTRWTFADLKQLLGQGLAAALGRRARRPRRRQRHRTSGGADACVADLPLKAFLQVESRTLRGGRGDPPHPRRARPRGVRGGGPSDGRRVPRMAARHRDHRGRADGAGAWPDAGDGGRGVEDHARPGSRDGGRQMPRSQGVPQHASACPGGCRPACSRTTRRTISRGIAASLLDGLMFGVGDAVIGVNPVTESIEDYEPRRDAPRRRPQPPRHSNADAAASATSRPPSRPCGAARRSISSSSRSQARRRPIAASASTSPCCAEAQDAALSLQRGTVGAGRHVFRDGPGERAFRRCASRRRSADHGGARLRRGAALPAPCSSTPSSASSARNISSTASRSSVPASKTISAASCSACRWAATSATPTMPRPTRTTWTSC